MQDKMGQQSVYWESILLWSYVCLSTFSIKSVRQWDFSTFLPPSSSDWSGDTRFPSLPFIRHYIFLFLYMESDAHVKFGMAESSNLDYIKSLLLLCDSQVLRKKREKWVRNSQKLSLFCFYCFCVFVWVRWSCR